MSFRLLLFRTSIRVWVCGQEDGRRVRVRKPQNGRLLTDRYAEAGRLGSGNLHPTRATELMTVGVFTESTAMTFGWRSRERLQPGEPLPWAFANDAREHSPKSRSAFHICIHRRAEGSRVVSDCRHLPKWKSNPPARLSTSADKLWAWKASLATCQLVWKHNHKGSLPPSNVGVHDPVELTVSIAVVSHNYLCG
jgi:hypothetical protein